MKKSKELSQNFKYLQGKAEERRYDKAAAVGGKDCDDAQKLIHELEVHQIELEMQNEELRSTQAKLVESRDIYNELYDFAPVGYFTLDEKAQIRRVNLTGAELLGLESSKLINTKFSRYISPDFRDDFYFHCQRIFESGTKQSCDLKLVKQDGTPFYARLDSIAVKDQVAASRQFRTAITDITVLVQAKKVLQGSEEKFRLMFHQMVSASALYEVIFNKRGQPVDFRFMEVNAAFENNTGKKREQVIGKTLLQVFPETESYWLQIFEEVALTGNPQEIENYHQGLDKYFYVSGFRPREGQVVATFIDISDSHAYQKSFANGA